MKVSVVGEERGAFTNLFSKKVNDHEHISVSSKACCAGTLAQSEAISSQHGKEETVN